MPTTDLVRQGQMLCEKLQGRWSGTQGMCRCPAHADRTPSLSVRVGHTALLFTCHAGCRRRDILAALRRLSIRPGMPRQPLPRRAAVVPTAEASRHLKLWERALPVQGTLGEAYLQSRGLVVPDQAPLRFLPRCRHHPTNSWRPALLAAFQYPDGRIAALHRLYLEPGAPRLISCGAPRMMTNSPGRAAIQLGCPGATLGLAEGLETGLAAAQLHGCPVWAAGSSARLHALDIPETVTRLFLFVDNDRAGDAAASGAVSAYLQPGRSVAICCPGPSSKDWNNMVPSGHPGCVSQRFFMSLPGNYRGSAMSNAPNPPDLRTRNIRLLNDRLRLEPFNTSYGTLAITAGVHAFLQSKARLLSQRTVACLWQLCRALAADTFGPENDPDGEHDFGWFEFSGRRFYFKINYYDPAMQWASSDPADPLKTRRVLTVGFHEDL